MINPRNFNWKNNQLYLGSKKTKFSVEKDHQIPDMFRVQYPDETWSYDYYNLSRAKDHCISEATQHINSVVLVPQEPVQCD